jgi:hypothetical protein
MAGGKVVEKTVWVRIKTMFDPTGFKEAFTEYRRLKTVADRMGINMAQAAGGIQRVGAKIKENKYGTVSLSRATIKMSNSMKSARRSGVLPFAGAWLSLMFIGQGLQSTFGGMISEIFKLTGVFDVWRATLISVLGPVLIPLSIQLIKLMSWFMKLDPETKKSIANFVIVAAVFGALLAYLSPLLILIQTIGGFGATWALLGVIGRAATKFLSTGLGKVLAVAFLVWELVKALGEMFENWGKKAWKVGRAILIILVAIVAIILIILGAPVALVAGIALVIIWLIKLISVFKPVRDFFSFIGQVLQGIGSFVMGKGFSAGFNSGVEQPKKMAAGGIVTRPTFAQLGERGPEAVIPLSGAGSSSLGGTVINYNPTLNFGTLGSGINVDEIARRVNERLYLDLRRVGIR